MIYAVHILDRAYVKVGYSADEDVSVRISQLQTGCPFEITPILTTSGSLTQEQELHRAITTGFTRIRVPIPPNDWFPGRNPFFTEFLTYLEYGPNAGLAYLDNYNQSVKQPGKGGARLEPNLRWPTLPSPPKERSKSDRRNPLIALAVAR